MIYQKRTWRCSIAMFDYQRLIRILRLYHRFIIVLSSFYHRFIGSNSVHQRAMIVTHGRWVQDCAAERHATMASMGRWCSFTKQESVRKIWTPIATTTCFLNAYYYIYISKTISIICLYSLEVSIVYLRFLLTYHWNTSCTDDSIYNETGDSCNDQKKFWDRCL